jgi:hypothetical protein
MRMDMGFLFGNYFFGFHLFVLGYLIFKSGYFPGILGILMVLGALGYLLDSYGNILFPNYEEIFGVIVGVTAVIGELPFFLWLSIKGVNVQRYNERAQQSR